MRGSGMGAARRGGTTGTTGGVGSSGQVEGEGTPSKSVYGVKSDENWELSADSQVAHTPKNGCHPLGVLTGA